MVRKTRGCWAPSPKDRVFNRLSWGRCFAEWVACFWFPRKANDGHRRKVVYSLVGTGDCFVFPTGRVGAGGRPQVREHWLGVNRLKMPPGQWPKWDDLAQKEMAERVDVRSRRQLNTITPGISQNRNCTCL